MQRLAEAPLVHGGHDFDLVELGAAAHDEHLVRVHPSSFDGDAPIRLVRRNGDVGRSERPAFEPANEAIEKVAALKFRLVELGIDVVVIEDELLAEHLERQADKEYEVRRIARVDDVEASRRGNPQGQKELPEQRRDVLERVAQRARTFERQRMAKDMDAVEHLVALPGALPFGADDRDVVAGRAKRRGLLPDTAIEWTRQVLDYDQDSPHDFHLSSNTFRKLCANTCANRRHTSRQPPLQAATLRFSDCNDGRRL